MNSGVEDFGGDCFGETEDVGDDGDGLTPRPDSFGVRVDVLGYVKVRFVGGGDGSGAGWCFCYRNHGGRNGSGLNGRDLITLLGWHGFFRIGCFEDDFSIGWCRCNA